MMSRLLTNIGRKASLLPFSQPVRFARSKPWIPRFRILRQYQPWPRQFDLQSIEKKNNQGTINERQKNRESEGLLPQREFIDRVNISSTGSIFEPFVPPEGDGKASLVSKERATQGINFIDTKRKSYFALRKIKKFDENFTPDQFVEIAEDLYFKAHTLLQNVSENEGKLLELVTEKAFSDMTFNLKYKTLRWKFLESIQPSKVVHIRTETLITKENFYSQITVRHFSKQVMAIYDRFGRLLYGNENAVRDVLEYVVYECHLSDEFSQWRLHGKIVPDWMPPLTVYRRTTRSSTKQTS